MFLTISMEQLEQYLDRGGQGEQYLLVDVRDRDSYARAHLEGSVNIPFDELDRYLGEIPRDKPVVLYCAHGSQSMLAARMLSRLGVETVNTAGGLSYYRGKHLTGK